MDVSRIDRAANRLREDMGGTMPWADAAESTKDIWRAKIREIAEILLGGIEEGDWRNLADDANSALQQRCYDLGVTIRHD